MYTKSWLLGRDLFIRITAVAPNDDGTFQALGEEVSLIGKLDSASIVVDTVSEEISPMVARKYNHVAIAEDSSLELREILDKSDDPQRGGNVLAACARSAYPGSHAKVVIFRGNKSWTFIGLIQHYEETYERGKNVGVMRLQVIDDSANPNPVYA